MKSFKTIDGTKLENIEHFAEPNLLEGVDNLGKEIDDNLERMGRTLRDSIVRTSISLLPSKDVESIKKEIKDISQIL